MHRSPWWPYPVRTVDRLPYRSTVGRNPVDIASRHSCHSCRHSDPDHTASSRWHSVHPRSSRPDTVHTRIDPCSLGMYPVDTCRMSANRWCSRIDRRHILGTMLGPNQSWPYRLDTRDMKWRRDRSCTYRARTSCTSMCHCSARRYRPYMRYTMRDRRSSWHNRDHTPYRRSNR